MESKGPMKKEGSRTLFLWVIVLFLVGCAVNPVTQRSQFSLMSPQQEVAIGRELYPLYTQMSYGLFQDPTLQDYVQTVGKRLASVSHRPNMPYEFNVVNGSEMNAYALPGGKISVTRGMVSKLHNEAQLAAVLAHEIGHVSAMHHATFYTRQTVASLLTGLGASMLQAGGGAGGDLLAQAGVVAANLVLMKYSRDQERQADELGMEYMVRAQYNPAGYVQTIALLQEEGQRQPSLLESFFSSHPLTTERIMASNRRLEQYGPGLRTPEALRKAPFREHTRYLRQVAPAYALMDEAKQDLSTGNAVRAASLLAQATAQAPKEALIWVFRAMAEKKAGKGREAVLSARRAVKLYPTLYHARYVAGVVLFDERNHRESLEQLTEANKIVADQPSVLFYMGRNWEAMGQRDRAARAYHAVLKKVQKGPMAQYCYQRLVEWGYLR
ncbi:M48 family metalloprotease [Desulfosoma caldarium]|uniref:Putative Zn-dependent protease n=1 Tax=Desulfosoma caldarium TaxID=610254 RepID=A0A3N1VU76_9BACT|nr:M48 family metalloprotease [Desulfosoma caldarium]ROR03327.1 putative Zn-dependent protease [Desulfosoma caldarium]